LSLDDRNVQERINPDRVIRRYGDGCLRRKCKPADCCDDGCAELIKRLWRILEADSGVGLAAPQIGVQTRVVIIRDPEAPVAKSRFTMVNPEVVETFGPKVPFEEGCLSFPGLYFDVLRPRGVVVNYTDESGHKHQVRNEGMLARIVQHEVDHLDGILFSDRLSFFGRLWLAPRLLLQWMGFLFWKLRSGK
jgi:peptide deformylase